MFCVLCSNTATEASVCAPSKGSPQTTEELLQEEEGAQCGGWQGTDVYRI